jgi:hypothetical protein
MNEWMVGAVVLPVLAGIFKNELGGLWKAWSVYKARPFDNDRDPDTPSTCELFNASSGLWEPVEIERYRMSLKKGERGVFLRYPDGTREKISLVEWAGMRKRK